jgi:putative tricarboxylic transport membrane protein
MVGLFVKLLSIRQAYLVPFILLLTFVGVYSIHGTTFDLVFMVGLGICGYVLRKLRFSMAPIILGVVLGEVLEDNLRRALSISAGEWSILYNSGLTLSLWAASVVVFATPLVLNLYKRRAVET